MSGRGRPGNADPSAGKRDPILGAARELFSDKGCDRTIMRAIAARAEVDPALPVIDGYLTGPLTHPPQGAAM